MGWRGITGRDESLSWENVGRGGILVPLAVDSGVLDAFLTRIYRVEIPLGRLIRVELEKSWDFVGNCAAHESSLYLVIR